MGPRNAEGKTKRKANGILKLAFQKIVFELLKPLPVGITLGIVRWAIAVAPRNVGHGPLRNDPHVSITGEGQGKVQRFLFRDVDGCL